MRRMAQSKSKGFQCWEENGKVYYKRYGSVFQVKKAEAVFDNDDPLGFNQEK